ncbi:hypothetical protein CFP65_0057 [Kitasatospora sp. MMS16-BH015]|uniref:hypothetical protein n=1 Tax=Kitasatospora sp. MMS16-BH015 TaxID=2018025 RepID=UPI000CA2B6C3|nr:hypothetical protein [Kitasatospora sp. MMS16-BH015]AUG75043.1 hypothetical protein CFP65_0057 [Kitasatospora sp. MMS16-BH015]
MESTWKPYWRRVGPPTRVVLLRRPDAWRYAVYFEGPNGVADGYLDGLAPGGEPEEAKAALCHSAARIAHRDLEIAWQPPAEPDAWIGLVTSAGPLPESDR